MFFKLLGIKKCELMTCNKYLSIIMTPSLPALSSGILIGNFLSKVTLMLKNHWRNKTPSTLGTSKVCLLGIILKGFVLEPKRMPITAVACRTIGPLES